MAVLGIIFAAMFMYGMLTAHYLAGMISLGMVYFMVYAKRELDKRDEEFYASPAGAKLITDTIHILSAHGCESSADRI